MEDILLLLLVGAAVGGFTLGLTGFGNGLASYGFWLHVIAPQLAAPLVAIGSLTGHLLMFKGFRHAIYPNRIVPFVVGGLAGIPVGTWLLTIISVPGFKLFGGALLAGYSIISLMGGIRVGPIRSNRYWDSFIGFLGGVCGGLASLSGPILTVWCGLRGWPKDEQRGTYQPFNFAMHVFALVAFGVAGLLTLELLKVVAISLPVTLISIWLGRRLYGRIDEVQFKRIILALLTLSGIALVGSGLSAFGLL